MANIPDVKIKLSVEDGEVKAKFQGAGQAVTGFANTVKKEGGEAAEAIKHLHGDIEDLKKGLETLGEVGEAFLSFEGLKKLGETLIEVRLEMDSLESSLKVATGTTGGAEREIEFLKETSDELGLSLEQVNSLYGKYAVAANQAGVSSATARDIFKAVGEATTAMGSKAEDTSRAMQGLTRMMSMGSINALTLRTQLGVAIPGVYENFLEKVKQKGGDLGELLRKNALDVKTYGPMLAEAIRDTVSAEDVAKGAQSLQAEINRSKNAWIELKEAFADVAFGEAAGRVFSTLATVLGKVAEASNGVGGSIAVWGLMGVAAIAAGRAMTALIGHVREYVGVLGQQIAAKQGEAAALTLSAERHSAEAAAIALSTLEEKANADVRASNAVLALEQAQHTEAVTLAKLAELEATAQGAIAEADLAAMRTLADNVTKKRVAAEVALEVATVASAIATQRNAVATAEATLAQNALAGAEVRAGAAAVGEAAAITAVGAAETVATVETVAMTGATITLSGAIAALEVAAESFLALIGGWPTLLFAAGAALLYFANQADTTSDSMDRLAKASEKAIEGMRKQSKAAADLKSAQTALDNFERGLGTKAPNEAQATQLRALQNRLKEAQGSATAAVEAQAEVQKQADEAYLAGTEAKTQAEEKLAAAKRRLLSIQNDPRLQGRDATGMRANAQDDVDKAEANLERVRDHLKEINEEKEKTSKIDQTALAQSKVINEENSRRADADAYLLALDEKATEAAEKKRLAEGTAAERAHAASARAVEDLKQQAFYKNASPERQTQYEAEAADAAARLSAAEEKKTKVKKAKVEVDKDANRVTREAIALTDRMNDGATKLAGATEDINKALSGEIDWQIDLERALANSNILYEQEREEIIKFLPEGAKKKELLDNLSQAYRNQTEAINEKAAAESAARLRMSADNVREAQFQSGNAIASRSDDILVREQAARDAATHLIDEKLRILDEAIAKAPDNEELLQEWRDLQTQRGLILDAMVSETEEKARQMNESMRAGFQDTIMGMMTGAITLRQGLAQIFSQIAQAWMKKMVAEPLAALMQKHLQETALGRVLGMQQVAQATQTSAQVMAVKSAETTAVAGANATQAATGAAASQAAVPVIGPGLAMVAMTAMFALVMAMANRTKKADGGQIMGPGTGTSDSIPAMLSHEEWVIKASSSKKYGAAFMKSINDGTFIPERRRARFADGGPVPQPAHLFAGDPQPHSSGPNEGDRAAPGVRVINVLDPRLLEDYLSDSRGERAILNVIERNPRRVKALLGN